MRLLITGGAGFIGSNLAREALERGIEVAIIDDLSTGYSSNLDGLDVDFFAGSILDDGLLARSMRGADSVVHLAALGSVPRSIKDPMASHEANATGTLKVVMAAANAGVDQLTVSSSSSVYGMNPALPKGEREWVRPMSPYAVTKLATEQYVLAFQQSFGLSSVAFRFFNVYGPGQAAGHTYAAVIPVFIDALLGGKPLPVNGDGEQSRDFTNVATVCDALLAATTGRVSHPEPINLAFGTNTKVLDIISKLEQVTGLTAQVEHRPERAGDVRHSQADNAVLRSVFPHIQPVELEQGLVETVEWFRKVGA